MSTFSGQKIPKDGTCFDYFYDWQADAFKEWSSKVCNPPHSAWLRSKQRLLTAPCPSSGVRNCCGRTCSSDWRRSTSCPTFSTLNICRPDRACRASTATRLFKGLVAPCCVDYTRYRSTGPSPSVRALVRRRSVSWRWQRRTQSECRTSLISL